MWSARSLPASGNLQPDLDNVDAIDLRDDFRGGIALAGSASRSAKGYQQRRTHLSRDEDFASDEVQANRVAWAIAHDHDPPSFPPSRRDLPTRRGI